MNCQIDFGSGFFDGGKAVGNNIGAGNNVVATFVAEQNLGAVR